MYSCLILPANCGISADEGAILKKIYQEYLQASAEQMLEFKSARENPGFFDLNSGAHRMGATSSEPFAKIFFNSDLIDPQEERLSLSSFVSIVVHELGHHTGLKDDAEHSLDQLGNKVAGVFSRGLERVTGEGARSKLELLVFNPLPSPAAVQDWTDQNLISLPYAYVSDGAKIYFVSDSAGMLVDCFFGTEVRHLWLSDFSWTSDHTLAGNDVHYCLAIGANEKKKRIESRFFINLDLTPTARILDHPDIQSVSTPAIEVESDLSQPNFLGLGNNNPVILESSRSSANPVELKTGGKWSVTLEARPGAARYTACRLLLGSDDFTLEYASGQKYSFLSSVCTITNAGGGKIQVRGSYEFPAGSPARTYYLRAVELKKQKDDFAPSAWILPKTRQKVIVDSSADKTAPEVEGLYVQFHDQTIRAPQFGELDYTLCHRFQIGFALEHGSHLKQAHLKYTLHYRNGSSPITLWARLTENRMQTWRFQEEPHADGSWAYLFDLYLFEEFMDPDQVDRIELRELTFLTENLQEVKMDFPRNALLMRASWQTGDHLCEYY